MVWRAGPLYQPIWAYCQSRWHEIILSVFGKRLCNTSNISVVQLQVIIWQHVVFTTGMLYLLLQRGSCLWLHQVQSMDCSSALEIWRAPLTRTCSRWGLVYVLTAAQSRTKTAISSCSAKRCMKLWDYPQAERVTEEPAHTTPHASMCSDFFFLLFTQLMVFQIIIYSKYRHIISSQVTNITNNQSYRLQKVRASELWNLW